MTDVEEKLSELQEKIAREVARLNLPEAGNIPVFPKGNPEAAIMLVGEGPGVEEEHAQTPFVGAAGRFLHKSLRSAGTDPERDVFISNVVRSRSRIVLPDGRVRNRPPTARHIAACRDYLEREVEIVHPRLIVTLGNTAGRWFLGNDFDLRRDHGRVFEWRGFRVLPTYHPAAAMRPFGPAGRDRARAFAQDLTRAFSLGIGRKPR